jgi:hypothetical protein
VALSCGDLSQKKWFYEEEIYRKLQETMVSSMNLQIFLPILGYVHRNYDKHVINLDKLRTTMNLLLFFWVGAGNKWVLGHGLKHASTVVSHLFGPSPNIKRIHSLEMSQSID